jgi:hypothetical protein
LRLYVRPSVRSQFLWRLVQKGEREFPFNRDANPPGAASIESLR